MSRYVIKLLYALATVTSTAAYYRNANTRCFECTSYMHQCGMQVDNRHYDVHNTTCKTMCYVRTGEDYATYRGCFDNFIDVATLKLQADFVGCKELNWNNKKLKWCFCKSPFCNGASMQQLENYHGIGIPRRKLDAGFSRLFNSGTPEALRDRLDNKQPGGKIHGKAGDDTRASSNNTSGGESKVISIPKQQFTTYSSLNISTPEVKKNESIREEIEEMDILKGMSAPHNNDDNYDTSKTGIKEEYTMKETNYGMSGEQSIQPKPDAKQGSSLQGTDQEADGILVESDETLNYRPNYHPHYVQTVDLDVSMNDDLYDLYDDGESTYEDTNYDEYEDRSHIYGSNTTLKSNTQAEKIKDELLPSFPQYLVPYINCETTGFYSNPLDCSSFVACIVDSRFEHPIMHLMKCPGDLIWHSQKKICTQSSKQCPNNSKIEKQKLKYPYDNTIYG